MGCFNRMLSTIQGGNAQVYRQAVRLNLRKSLSSSENLLRYQKSGNLSRVERESLERGAEQLRVVLHQLESEMPESSRFLEKFAQDPYTRQSVSLMKSTCGKISSGAAKILFRSAFRNLSLVHQKPIVFRNQKNSQFQVFSKTQWNLEKASSLNLIINALRRIEKGEFLTKLHYRANGGKKQYFKVVDGTEIRWTSKEVNIGEVKHCHSCNCFEVGRNENL